MGIFTQFPRPWCLPVSGAALLFLVLGASTARAQTGPDLEVTDINFSSPPTPGVQTIATATLKNRGGQSSGLFDVKWFVDGALMGHGRHASLSAGQTSIDAKPIYGRMFQTPFSDRIRNEANIATMAVGNIYEPDHVNSILMAGRADLVCLGRPHLADPYWTLHAAVALGDADAQWPLPYLPGRDQAVRLAERAQEIIRA